MHYGFDNLRNQQPEETKVVTFKVEPLMCMEKCAKSISLALATIQITQAQYDVQNKLVTVTMPASMENQKVIGTLQAHGRRAEQHFPAQDGVRKGFGMGFGSGFGK